jgi:YggT family protein
LISWIQVDPYNPIVQFLFRTTEPFLAPVRRLMAQYFPNLGFDLSPIVVLILAQIVQSLVLRLLFF